MNSRFRILSLILALFMGIVGLCIFLTLDRKATNAAQLQENLAKSRGNPKRDLNLAPKADFSAKHFAVGVLTPGDQRTQQVHVKNTGPQKLKIKLLGKNDERITTKLFEDEIAPGRATAFDLSLTAPLEPGPFDFQVSVGTNDPFQEKIDLNLQGEVKRTVWSDHLELNFGKMSPDETPTQELRIFTVWPEGCVISNWQNLPAGVNISSELLSSEELKAAEAQSGQLVSVTCDAEFKGALNQRLLFTVSRLGSSESRQGSTEQVEKGVDFSAHRQARLSLSHEKLNQLGELKLGNIPYGTGYELVLFLEARGENRILELERVECSPNFFEVRLSPGVNAETSGLYRLHFKIPADAPVGSYSGVRQGSVTLHFTDSSYPPMTFHPLFFITQE